MSAGNRDQPDYEGSRLLDERLDEVLAKKLRDYRANRTPSIVIIASKGTLDWAYPPFILGSTAAALGWDTRICFTVYGLVLVMKDLGSAISPVGNPAMPMKMPFGPTWLKQISWPMPNLVTAGLPGFERVATSLMKTTFRSKGVPDIAALRSLCIDAGALFYACQMTMQVIGVTRGDLIPEVVDCVSAVTFLEMVRKSDMCIYV
jgi:peroxiredoxin family protein